MQELQESARYILLSLEKKKLYYAPRGIICFEASGLGMGRLISNHEFWTKLELALIPKCYHTTIGESLSAFQWM